MPIRLGVLVVYILLLGSLLTTTRGLVTTLVRRVAACQDATIFQKDTNHASGADHTLFVGTNGGPNEELRTLIRFNVSFIPSGSEIHAVLLTLHATELIHHQPIAVHRLTSDWGAGPSNANGSIEGEPAVAGEGDATWSHAFYTDDAWQNAGGDFIGNISFSYTIVSRGDFSLGYTNRKSRLSLDIQAWVDGTAPNYGWILMGPNDRDSHVAFGAMNATYGQYSIAPALTIAYIPPHGSGGGAGVQVPPSNPTEAVPTALPTASPTASPTEATMAPTNVPTTATVSPTQVPATSTTAPTSVVTSSPTDAPVASPTAVVPTESPTPLVTRSPSARTSAQGAVFCVFPTVSSDSCGCNVVECPFNTQMGGFVCSTPELCIYRGTTLPPTLDVAYSSTRCSCAL
mmetsp:Transcript_11948/g.13161  ORF Transcript_11948/g.13161 Transcript_11948/m.13161 type:complete len:401 (-) Transcript_11948:141-1343(-)